MLKNKEKPKQKVKKHIKYSDQLKNVRWIRKRNAIIKRDKYACTKCHSQDITLNVHHLYYIQDALAWQYPHKALITLCERCHRKWHEENILEIREKSWNKNKNYNPPQKKKSRFVKYTPKPKPSLGELQVKDRYRKKVNGEWVIS